jgi:hypothetical protein
MNYTSEVSLKRTAFTVALSLAALGSLQAAEPRGSSAPFCPVAAATGPAPLFLSSSPPQSPNSVCTASLETDYYSDASHSTKVGMCVITCHQWDLGNYDPRPNQCTGTITSFPGGGPLRFCPCPL